MADRDASATALARTSPRAASTIWWRRHALRALTRRGAGTTRSYCRPAASAGPVHRPAADHRAQHLRLADRRRGALHRVLGDHDEVGELAHLEGAGPALGAHLVRALRGDRPERLAAREARVAVEPPLVAARGLVAPGDADLDREELVERVHRPVAAEGDARAGVLQAPLGLHPLEALGTHECLRRVDRVRRGLAPL